jgi:hypothetical protein
MCSTTIWLRFFQIQIWTKQLSVLKNYNGGKYKPVGTLKIKGNINVKDRVPTLKKNFFLCLAGV